MKSKNWDFHSEDQSFRFNLTLKRYFFAGRESATEVCVIHWLFGRSFAVKNERPRSFSTVWKKFSFRGNVYFELLQVGSSLLHFEHSYLGTEF